MAHTSSLRRARPCAPVGRGLCPDIRKVPSRFASGTPSSRAAWRIVATNAGLVTAAPSEPGKRGSSGAGAPALKRQPNPDLPSRLNFAEKT